MVMRSGDRQLKLEIIDLKNKNTGLVDPQIFAGNNRLRAIMDPVTLNWFFKYDHGVIPPALKDKYTSFNIAKKQAETYFKTRNIRITEVID